MDHDPEKAYDLLAGAVDKYVKQQARNTIVDNSCEDERCVGFKRTATPDSCPYCHSQASPTPSKDPSSAGSFHEHCDCPLDPVYEGEVARSKKLDEINEREDLSEKEKDLLRLCVDDVYRERTVESSRRLAGAMKKRLGSAFSAAKKEGTKEAYDGRVNKLLKAIGDVYGVDISAEYAPKKDKDWCSAKPYGDEVYAICRLSGMIERATFRRICKREHVLSVDLMIDGEYVDVKTPREIGSFNGRLKHAVDQCREAGQKSGVVILSDLNCSSDFAEFEERARSFIRSGAISKVYVVRMISAPYLL